MKKNIWIAVVVIVVALIVISMRSDKSLSLSGEPIKIGQMSGLTGIGSDIGEEERNGTLLAIEQANENGGIDGRPILMISEDTPTVDLGKGAGVAAKLISIDNVLAIVGPQWDGQGEVMAAVSKDKKIPVISQNVSTDIESKIDSPYFFVTWPDDEVGVQQLLKFAADKGWNDVAIIQPGNYSFWTFTTDLAKNNASKYGVNIVSTQLNHDFSVLDYRTLITKTKAYKPDAILGTFSDLNCVILKQTKEQGLDVPLLSTDSGGNPKPLTQCPELMEGRLFFSTLSRGSSFERFVSDYEERFGHKPLVSSSISAYNAGLVLVDALKTVSKSGKELNRENVREAIEATKLSGGVSVGTIEFNDKGYMVTPADAYEIWTVRNGKFVKAD